uniref:Reverse transcriptase domain-containing protein n=1 Tax=Trichuris muris TaxID=70415 RepID=A0A5S6PYN9_TRIMR
MTSDPTDGVRRSLSALLTNFAMETGDKVLSKIRQHIYYTSNKRCPELYGLPKIHKEGVPLRPVVSSFNSVTSKLCSYLNTILRPLTGNRPSFVKNSKDFCNDIRQLLIAPTDIVVSYDVKDLFTSIPMTHTHTQCVRRTPLCRHHPYKQDEPQSFPYNTAGFFCMREGNYFRCQDKFFSQTSGAPMGSALSPILAEIFMEHFEERAFSTAPPSITPRLFKLYVDDIFSITKAGYEELFLDYLDGMFPQYISLTIERETGILPLYLSSLWMLALCRTDWAGDRSLTGTRVVPDS